MEIKNIDIVNRTWGGVLFQPNDIYVPANPTERQMFANDSIFLADLASNKAELKENGVVISDFATAVGILRGDIGKVEITSMTPFAKPDYRTKRAKNTNGWVTCPANQVTHIDYLVTEERFVSGGEIMTKNVKEGDYVTAEVYDGHNGGIIPEAYRAALCENWPTVAAYLDKWLKPANTENEYSTWELSTYPLNAQISPYLILRVSYHASAVSGDRKCAVNYHLTKKL